MTSTLQAQSSFSPPAPPATGSAVVNVGTEERILSLAGGALLAAAGVGSRASLLARLGMLAASGPLMWRGITGHSALNERLGRDTATRARSPLTMQAVLTVTRSRDEVYDMWRRFEDFPRFMKHVEEVTVDGTRSHWVVPVPGGFGSVEWDAELRVDEPGRRIAWSSLPGSTIDNAGEVRFAEAPGRRGTEVHARIWYRAPAGDAGRFAARLLGPAFEQLVHEDLRRFKSLCEADEVPTIEGQPQGGR